MANTGQLWGHQGFWGSGEKGYLFSGSLGELVILGFEEQDHSLEDLGSTAKK